MAPLRKPPVDKKLLKAFQPFIVERLATGAFLLAKVWMAAWNKASRPDLSSFNAVSFPYPLDVPYIWPEYAKETVLSDITTKKK